MSRRRSLWVPHPAEVYVIAEADADAFANSADVLQVVTSDGQTLKVKKQQCVEINDAAGLTEQCDDLILLREVNEATILHTLRARFKQDKIYTAIGTVLVSLNPFRPIEGLYDKATVLKYTKAMYSHAHDTLPPHVFVIAASAFNNMRINQMPQSILISGESGAGKTEATKQCLQFLSTSSATDGASSSAAGSMTIEQKVIAASPILEAFGNAKTVRNDNSSRFGKWINILFRTTAPGMVQMVACQTTSYLLEKSRVTRQEADERNFHIFYQLLAHPDEALRSRACLRAPESYWYLSQSGCITLPSQDDAANYREVLESFGVLGFSPETVECIKAVTAAVLTLGNINFDPINDGEGSKLSESSVEELQVVSRLLEVPPELLEQNLVEKTIQAGSTRRSFTKVLLRPAEATAGRDALARNVFQNLFEKILVEINRLSLGDAQDMDERLAIGILDIFGFEIFTTNSLEQLCINYANEALQKHFNNHIFTLETQLYAEEGVRCEQIAFRDNTQVISLIQSAFLALDEEGRIPKGTADTFFSKFKRAHSDAKHKQLVEFPALRPTFKIAHYAGSVEYDPAQFMNKNKDTYSTNLVATLQASSNAYISELFAQPVGSPAPPSARQSKAKETVTSLFRAQMQALLTNLEQTKSHFIRCVKSNAAKKPREMDALLVYDQLRCSGVLEIVQIQQSGLPFRYKHDVFVKRCSPIVRWRFREHGYDTSELVADAEHVVSDLCRFYPELNFQIGRTMVFYTASENRMLETALQHIQRLASISMQRHIRGFICRVLRQRVFAARRRGADAVKDRNASALEAVLGDLQQLQERYRRLTGSLVLQDDVTAGQATLRKFVLQDACAKRLDAVLRLDLFEHVIELEQLLDEADSLDFDAPLVHEGKRQLATVRQVLGALALLDGDMSRVSVEQLHQASTTVAASADRIRSAFPNRDVNALLTRAETRLGKLRVEVNQHFPKMAEALRTGSATYAASGECIAESVLSQTLESVRAEVAGLAFESEDCTAARQMVNSIIGLRHALARRDIQGAQRALSACESIELPTVQAIVHDELLSARAYVASECSVQALMEAFSAAMLPPDIPLQYPEAKLGPLQEAIEKASNSPVPLLPFAAARLQCVELLCRVRHGLATGRIKLATDALDALRKLRQSGDLMPSFAEECDVAQQHVVFFQVRDGLDEIVRSGPPMLQEFDVLREDDRGPAELLSRLDDMARRLEDLKLKASGSTAVAPLVSRVQLLLSLRYSLLRQDMSQIGAKLEKIRSAHPGWGEAAPELQMSQRMFELLRLREQLLEGLSQGKIKWAMRSPDVDVAAVSEAALRSALEQASNCQHATAPLDKLIRVCNLIRQGRRLVLDGYSAEELEHVVQSLDAAAPLPPPCVEELAVLKELTARAFAMEAMVRLLQDVVASGSVGSMKVRATSEAELSASLDTVKQAVARAQPIPALSKLFEACEYLTAVRCAVMASDRWGKVRDVLAREHTEITEPAAVGELGLLRAEMQHEDTIAALLAGCAAMQFTSRIGELRASEIETQQLESALALAEKHGTYNSRSVALKHICQALLHVRRGASARAFDSISDHTLGELEHNMEQQHLDTSEVRRYQYELQNYAATVRLKATLMGVADATHSAHHLDELITDVLEWCDRLPMRSEQCNCLTRVARCYLQLLRAASHSRHRETVEHADAVARELAAFQHHVPAEAAQEDARLSAAVQAAAAEQRQVAEGHLLAAELRELISRSQIRGRPFHLLYDAGGIAGLAAFLQDERRGKVLQQYSEYHGLLAAASASLHIRQQIAADRRRWFNAVTEEDLAQANHVPANHDENRLLRSDFALQKACSDIEACLASNAFAQASSAAAPSMRQQVLTELGAAVNVLLKSSDALPEHVRALAAVGNELISIGYEWSPDLASHSLPVVTELNASLRRRIAEVERHCTHLAIEVQQCVYRITGVCLSHYDDALGYARLVDLLQQGLAALTESGPATRQQRAATLGKLLADGLSAVHSQAPGDGGGHGSSNSRETTALLDSARKFAEAARLGAFGQFDAAARSVEAVGSVLEQIPQRTRGMVQHVQTCFAQLLEEPDNQPTAANAPPDASMERQVVSRTHYRDAAQILPSTEQLCTVDPTSAIVRRSLLVAFSDHPDVEIVVATQRRADVLCDLLSAIGTLASSITDKMPLTDVLASPDEFLYVDYWRIESAVRRVSVDDPAFAAGSDELATVLVDIANRLLNLVTASWPCLGLGQSAALLDLLDIPFSDLLVDEHTLLQEAASRWVAAATQVKSLVYQVRIGAQILENFRTTDEDLQAANQALEAAAAELAAIAVPASCVRVLQAAELMLNLRNEAQSPSTDEQFHEYMVEWASLPQLLRVCGEAHLDALAKAHSKACHRRHVDELLERLASPTLVREVITPSAQTVFEEVLHTPSVAMYPDELHMWEAVLSLISLLDCRTAAFMEDKVTALRNKYHDRIPGVFFEHVLFACKKQQILQHCWDYVHAKEEFPDELLDPAFKGRDEQVDYVLDAIFVLRTIYGDGGEGDCGREAVDRCSRDVHGLHYLRDAVEHAYWLVSRKKLTAVVREVEAQLTGEFARELFASPANPTPAQQRQLDALAARLDNCQHVPMGVTLQHWVRVTTQAVALLINDGTETAPVMEIAQTIATLPGSEALREFGAQLAAFLEWRCAAEEILELLAHGVKIVDSVVVAPPAAALLRLLHISSHIRGHAQAGQFLDLAELLMAVHDLRVTATCDAELGDKLPVMISRAKAALTRATTKGLKPYIPETVESALKAEIGALADYIPSYMSTKELQRVLAAKTGDCAPLEAAIAFTEQFDNLDEQTQVLLERSRLVLKLRKAQASEAWLMDSDRAESAHACVEQIVQDWFECGFYSGPGAAEFQEARNVCAEHRLEALLEELEASVQDDDQLQNCLERTLHFAIQHRAQLSTDAYEEVDACMAVYNVLTAYSGQRWGVFWQHSRSLRIFSTGLPVRLQFLTPVLERVQKTYHEALLCDYLLSVLLNVERPVAKKWFEDNKTLLSTLENCIAWVHLEPLIRLLMTGSMADVVAEWTRCSAHLKHVLDSADENDLLVAALVARLCLLKRTYLSEVVTSVNAKIFTEAETIEDALNQYPLVHAMLEAVKDYQLDKVDLELRNIDECWNLLFHFSDCTGDAEKTACLATIPNAIQAQRVRHLLYEKYQSQTALDMTIQLNDELCSLGPILRTHASMVDCMQEIAWHYATLDGLLKKSKAIMLQSGSSVFEDLQVARARAKQACSLRKAVLQQNWPQVVELIAAIRQSPHGVFLAEEAAAMEVLYLHLTHLNKLQKQLATGPCGGELGEMDEFVDDINLDGLQQVLSEYTPSKEFAISGEIEQLRESAMFVLRLREAVIEGAWGEDVDAAPNGNSAEGDEAEEAETVAAMLKQPIALQPIPAVAAEIQRVRDELHNKTAARLLEEALSRGASYVEDINDFRLVDCETLQHAISKAVALNRKSARVQLLLPAAQKVRQLRLVVTNGEWSKLRSFLEELKDADIPSEIAAEVNALRAIDHINFALQEKILSAIQRGRVRGTPTQLDTRDVSVTDLNAALVFAAQRNIHSKADQSLIRTGELLRDLRLCVLSSDFKSASERLKGSTVSSLHPGAREELLLIEAAVEIIDVLEELTQALLLDAPTGRPGSFSTATIKTRRIEKVLASTSTSELESMNQLAPSIRAIRDLRNAVCSGKWDERVVAGNPVLRKPTPSTFRTIQLVQPDVPEASAATQNISHQLYKKLASSTLSSTFQSAVAPRPVHASEVPVAVPRTSDNFNPDSRDVHNSTIAITRALQMLGLSQDSVAFALSRLPAKMSSYVEQEVRLVRNELYHRVVCHALQAAIAPLCTTDHSGIAGDRAGDAVIEDEQVIMELLQELEGAMCVAHHLGLPSPQSRRLYNTAFVMHSVRKAELSSEWDATSSIANLVKAGKNQQLFEDFVYQEVQLACARHQFRVITLELERQLSTGDVVFETRSEMQKLRQAWQRGMPGANIDEDSLVMLDVTNTLHDLRLANKSRNFDAIRKCCDELADVLDRLPSKFQQFRHLLEVEVSHQRRLLLEQKLPFLNFGAWLHSEVTGLTHLQGVLSRLIESALAPFFRNMADKPPVGVAFETVMVRVSLRRHALLRQFLDQSNKVLASVSAEGRNHPELRRQFLQTAYSAVFVLATSLLCVRELLRPEPGESGLPRLRSRSNSHSTRGSIATAATAAPAPRNSMFTLGLQATVSCIPQVVCSSAADALASLATESKLRDNFSSSTILGEYLHQVTNFAVMAGFVTQLQELLQLIDPDSGFTITQQALALLPRQIKLHA